VEKIVVRHADEDITARKTVSEGAEWPGSTETRKHRLPEQLKRLLSYCKIMIFLSFGVSGWPLNHVR